MSFGYFPVHLNHAGLTVVTFIHSITVLWGVDIIREDGDGICCCSGQPLQCWTFGLWMAGLSPGEPWPFMNGAARKRITYINKQSWWLRKIRRLNDHGICRRHADLGNPRTYHMYEQLPCRFSQNSNHQSERSRNTRNALDVVSETPTMWLCPSGGINHQDVTELLLVFQRFCRFEAQSEHSGPFHFRSLATSQWSFLFSLSSLDILVLLETLRNKRIVPDLYVSPTCSHTHTWLMLFVINALDATGEWSRPRLTGCRRDGRVHSPTLNLLAARRATSVAQNVWQLWPRIIHKQWPKLRCCLPVLLHITFDHRVVHTEIYAVLFFSWENWHFR